jgi:hypothetical protein
MAVRVKGGDVDKEITKKRREHGISIETRSPDL